MVFGTSFSHPYHRSPADPRHELNVLCMGASDPISPLSLDCIATEQNTQESTLLYEKEADVLREKLKCVENILSLLKSRTPASAPVLHRVPQQCPITIHAPVNRPNLDARTRAETKPLKPTLKELQTIDEGTGQKAPVYNGDPGGNQNSSAPTLAEMKSWCSISD